MSNDLRAQREFERLQKIYPLFKFELEDNKIEWKENLGQGGIPTLINGDISYTGYDRKISIGSLCRVSTGHGWWSLQVPSAEIDLHGEYRNELIEEAGALYEKFVNAHKSYGEIFDKYEEEIIGSPREKKLNCLDCSTEEFKNNCEEFKFGKCPMGLK